jgi:hypothetical protein
MPRAYKIALSTIIFLSIVLGGSLYSTLHRIDTSTSNTTQIVKTTQCSDRLLGAFALAVGHALEAPAVIPSGGGTTSPSSLRQQAVDEIQQAADNLAHSAALCP